jgi:GIY-YIG catalytic domain
LSHSLPADKLLYRCRAGLGNTPTWVLASNQIHCGAYVAQNLDGHFYIGMTTDLEARIRDHHSGRRTTFQRFWVRY